MTDFTDRRREPRHVLTNWDELESSLLLLLPEETFRPRELGVRIVDISRVGMKVRTSEIDRELVHKLRSDTRYGKLKIRFKGREKSIRSRIVWINRYDEAEKTVTEVGMCCDGASTDERQHIDEIIEHYAQRARDYPAASMMDDV